MLNRLGITLMYSFDPPTIVVDGSYLLHRTYHAVPPMYSDGHILTNAVFGTIKHILHLLNTYSPTYMAVVVDRPEPSFRHELSPTYKAQRPPYPEEFTNQIPWVIAILEALGIRVVSIPGIEGDDAIGTLACMAEKAGELVMIATADKDMMQLVNSNIYLHDSFKGSIVDIEAVYQKFNVYPEQIADLLALMGDKADGIAGVMGVGKVAAANLLCEYNNLAGIIEAAPNISGALGIRLRAGLESLAIDRKLTGIVTDMPINITMDDLIVQPTDTLKLNALYQQLNFSSLL